MAIFLLIWEKEICYEKDNEIYTLRSNGDILPFHIYHAYYFKPGIKPLRAYTGKYHLTSPVKCSSCNYVVNLR